MQFLNRVVFGFLCYIYVYTRLVSGVGVDFELLVRSLHVRNKRALRKQSGFLGGLEDKTKRFSNVRVSNIFFQKENMRASRRDRRPICKSKTSPCKVMIIFSDSIFADGLQKGLLAFNCLNRQLLTLRWP